MRLPTVGWLLVSLGLGLYVGCGGDDAAEDPPASTAGTGGDAGSPSGGAPDGEAGESAAEAGSGGSGQAGVAGGGGLGGAGGQGEPGEFVIASDQEGPTGIAIDADNVYWANQDAGTIVSCPLTGCGADSPTEIVADQDGVRGIAVDGATLYWIRDLESDDLARVRKCPIADCSAPEVLIELGAFRPNDVHVDGDVFYYGAWPLFGSCPTDGCLVSGQVTLNGGPVVSVDSDADYIYWALYGSREIHRCAKPDCSDDTVLVSDTVPLSIAVDETTLYFAAYDFFAFDAQYEPHEILKCPLEGCGTDEPEIVKSDISPYAIAVNQTRLFFTDVEQGTVVSMPK